MARRPGLGAGGVGDRRTSRRADHAGMGGGSPSSVALSARRLRRSAVRRNGRRSSASGRRAGRPPCALRGLVRRAERAAARALRWARGARALCCRHPGQDRGRGRRGRRGARALAPRAGTRRGRGPRIRARAAGRPARTLRHRARGAGRAAGTRLRAGARGLRRGTGGRAGGGAIAAHRLPQAGAGRRLVLRRCLVFRGGRAAHRR